MAKIDRFILSLSKFGANAVILKSNTNIHFRLSKGIRSANQNTSHEELVSMIREVASTETLDLLKLRKSSIFEYEFEKKIYQISVDINGSEWITTIEPANILEEDTQSFRNNVLHLDPTDVSPHREHSLQFTSAHEIPLSDLKPIEKLLVRIKELGASDLHVSSNVRPMARIHGEMGTLDDFPIYDSETLKKLLFDITPEKNVREFEERNDTDFAHAIPKVSRFRANLFRDRNGPCAVFRVIPFEIMSPEQIGLPKNVLDLCYLSKGLVLVTGPTGSGKSTTLATLVDHVNKNRQDHIITIEDPIEFLHENKKCLVNQREVHSHTESFKDALRAALREDPDIVLVGEMRDLETIAIAVETAETGHLVFGTLHTSTAPSTVDRIIDQFPADRQEQIRQMLAESLRGIISQTLCRKIGTGRIAAYEVLLGSNAVSNIIREKKTFQLFSLMQTSRAQGMITLNDSLIDLVKRGLIDPMEAYIKAVNKSEFKNLLAHDEIVINI